MPWSNKDSELPRGVLSNKAVNKDGRLIKLDYVLPSQRRLVTRGNIISFIKRLAFYSFFPTFKLLQLLERASVVWGCTRLRLVSEAR